MSTVLTNLETSLTKSTEVFAEKDHKHNIKGIAGVRFAPTEAAGERLELAANMMWEKSTDVTKGLDDFPEKFNCFNTYEALVKNGKIVATEGSYEFEQYKDDDEYDADVFVMFPKGYGRRYIDESGYEYRYVSDKRLSGFSPSPLHYVEGKEYDIVGITKYGWCDNGNGGLCSRANKPHLVNIDWQTFEKKSVARGNGLHALSYTGYSWLQHLGCIKYANRNWQETVGYGVDTGYTEIALKKCSVSQSNSTSIIIDNETAKNFAINDPVYLTNVTLKSGICTRKIINIENYDDKNKRITVDGQPFDSTAGSSGFYRAVSYSGGCNSVLGLDGEISGGINRRKSVLTLGVEDLYANYWKLTGNAFRQGTDIYINTKPLTSPAWPSSVNDAIAKGWIKVAEIPSTEGYVKSLYYNENCPFISVPATVGGNSSKPVGDYFYTNTNNDLKILLFCGSLGDGVGAGLFFCSVGDWLGGAWFDGGAFGAFFCSH